MSENQVLIQNLVYWAKSHQAYLHPDVEIYEDPVTGFSFRAVKDIPPSSQLVTCTYQLSLSYLNAVESPHFQHHQSESFPEEFLESLSQDDPNIIGHFFLMQQYLMGEKSFWWPYIRLLPQPNQPERLGIPIWWPEADERFLVGTNAEPPLKKRRGMWMSEWDKGISALRNRFSGWEKYDQNLYQWAATIFGTRSFRASLTIAEEMLRNDTKNLDHVKKDKFSTLLPVLDIGNHNGINQVDWKRCSTNFGLSNRDSVTQGSQIFNFYGDKSNSELLVGYGFTTSDSRKDTVNLQLKPGPDAIHLRRSQSCYLQYPQQQGQEFMFNVRNTCNDRGNDGKLKKLVEFQAFSNGLVDLIACMVANMREQRFMLRHPEYCIENDTTVFESFMSRNALLVLYVLQAKLEYEVRRIQDCGAGLGEPRNNNQLIAVGYRERQLSVLKAAIPPIVARLDSIVSFSSFCQHDHQIDSNPTDLETNLTNAHSHVELLSLECGFEWLRLHYLEIFSFVVGMISEDQDEPLPLNWAILVEDWDHTYWLVWICIVRMLWARDSETFGLRHKNLNSWMISMNEAYDEELSLGEAGDTLHAEPSEQATIDHMIRGITQISSLITRDMQDWGHSNFVMTRLRNFASFVAEEETFPVAYKVQHGPQTGEIVEQKMLCISTKTIASSARGRLGGNLQAETWISMF